MSQKLLADAIGYLSSSMQIMEEEYSIIMHSRKTLLFQNSEAQVKKDVNKDFDVPILCHDGTETCQPVDSFILNQLGSVTDKYNIDFYRDDNLGIFGGISKPMVERNKKLTGKTFKQCGIAITVECDLKTVNFLDIKFDFQNNVYKPCRKANDKPTQMDKNSNHPPSLLKQLKKFIEKRFSETSSSNDIFDKSLKFYHDALKDSGFSNGLHYVESNSNTNDNKREDKKKSHLVQSSFFQEHKDQYW